MDNFLRSVDEDLSLKNCGGRLEHVAAGPISDSECSKHSNTDTLDEEYYSDSETAVDEEESSDVDPTSNVQYSKGSSLSSLCLQGYILPVGRTNSLLRCPVSLLASDQLHSTNSSSGKN